MLLAGLLLLAASVAGPSPVPPEITVAYEVTGSGRVEVRYEDADGALAVPATVSLPWRKTFTVPADVRFLTVTAGRTAPAEGDVACRITADGALIALDGLSGGYVQCTGAVSR